MNRLPVDIVAADLDVRLRFQRIQDGSKKWSRRTVNPAKIEDHGPAEHASPIGEYTSRGGDSRPR